MNPYDLKEARLQDDAERFANFVLESPDELSDWLLANEINVGEGLSRCFRNLARARMGEKIGRDAIVEALSQMESEWFLRLKSEHMDRI